MTRVLSILLAVTVVVVLVTLIGAFIRTPRFAVIRDEIERQVRATTTPDEAIEPEIVLEA